MSSHRSPCEVSPFTDKKGKSNNKARMACLGVGSLYRPSMIFQVLPASPLTTVNSLSTTESPSHLSPFSCRPSLSRKEVIESAAGFRGIRCSFDFPRVLPGRPRLVTESLLFVVSGITRNPNTALPIWRDYSCAQNPSQDFTFQQRRNCPHPERDRAIEA